MKIRIFFFMVNYQKIKFFLFSRYFFQIQADYLKSKEDACLKI